MQRDEINRLKVVSIEWPFCFINIMGEKIIDDGVEASTRKSKSCFQII